VKLLAWRLVPTSRGNPVSNGIFVQCRIVALARARRQVRPTFDLRFPALEILAQGGTQA